MTTELDDRLAAARPAVRAADPGLDDALAALIVASEVRSRSGRQGLGRRGLRLRTKIIVGGVAGALVLGTASAALASSERWSLTVAHPDSSSRITLPSGQVCDVRTVAQLNVGVSYGLPELQAARAFMRTIDVSSFDLAKLRSEYVANGQVSGTESIDRQTYDAAGARVADLTWDHLAKLGYNVHDLGITSEGNCSGNL